MQLKVILSLILVVGLAVVNVQCDELPLAEVCDEEACVLPDCRCSSTNIPGGLAPRDTPQFVVVTYEEAVNVVNIETYRNILFGRRNLNGCPAGATFYVNHEYTDYTRVNELYNNGFEIGLHSISRSPSSDYWATASYETLVNEFVHQRSQLSHFANIPFDSIKGLRLPFLQLSGNTSFELIVRNNLGYDHSWLTVAYSNPGLYPYTLDYASIQDCVGTSCPTASIPGAWTLPIISWTDLTGFPCATIDACFSFPDREDENAWYAFILGNFERHYLNSRAPFPLAVTPGYLAAYPAVQRAVTRFLNLVNNLNDVFMVTASEVIDWVKEPTPVNEYRARPCRTFIPTNCPSFSCGPYVANHNQVWYWMQVCTVCPRVYPWLGNPLGQ